MLELGSRQVWLMHLHEIDAHEDRLVRPGHLVEVLERRLLDIFVKERNAAHSTVGCFHVLTVNREILMRWLPCVSRQRALRYAIEHLAQVWGHIREPGWVTVGVALR